MKFHNHDDPFGVADVGYCGGLCCLRLDNVGVNVGGAELLHGVSLHLHCGEIAALIGPNGAGKSSLFKAILGQLPHTGAIEFRRPGGKGPSRPVIGYVPQAPAFDPADPVTVLDFFAAATASHPVFLPVPRGLREQVGRRLERTHAADLMDKRLGALSGGEVQRFLMALALEPLPQILILDEPLSGVDVDGERQLLDMLDELRREYDMSILLSTHDFATLEGYADKVLLLKNTLLKAGTPEEVLSSPEFRDVFHLRLGKGAE